MKYILEKTEDTDEQVAEAYKLIEGLEDIQDFQFHDSKPVEFEHTSEKAKLKVEFDGIIVTFLFDGLIEINVSGDPIMNWINDFHCYPLYNNKKILHFDVGYYRIMCEKIKVVSVEQIEKPSWNTCVEIVEEDKNDNEKEKGYYARKEHE